MKALAEIGEEMAKVKSTGKGGRGEGAVEGSEQSRDQSSRLKEAKNPRLLPLSKSLEAIFLETQGIKYQHGGAKDVLALKRLLLVATDSEICAAWRKGLLAQGFEHVSTFAELAMKSNRLRAKEAANPNVYREAAPTNSEDPANAPFGPCAICGKGAWAMFHVEGGRVALCAAHKEIP